VTFVGNTVLGRDLQVQELLDGKYAAVFLALGAHRALELGIENGRSGQLPAVVDALSYLSEALNGGAPATGRRVVVVGGGNAAIDAARTARRLGADEVRVVYRRQREAMPALADEIDEAEREGVELRLQMQPLRLEAEGIVCVRTEPGEPDESGRRRPVPVPDSETRLDADLVIAAVGQRPRSGFLALEQKSDGCLQVNAETLQTSDPRIFAGGDLVPGERTVTGAISTGQRAAWGIDRELRGRETADLRSPPPPPNAWPPAATRGRAFTTIDTSRRQQPGELPVDARGAGFAETVDGLTEAQARAEGGRCAACGQCGNCRICIDLFGCPAFHFEGERIVIDPKLCTGCGICVEFCPNGAIHAVERTPS